MSNEDFQSYLKTLHNGSDVSEQLLRQVAEGFTGVKSTGVEHIIAGEVNEVYEIPLEGRSPVILRLSPNGSPDFQQEEWAINQVSKLGVPTPGMLLIKYIQISEKDRSICLMNKCQGEVLGALKIDDSSTSSSILKSYIYQAGQILSKIHSISTLGWGKIIGDGESAYTSASEMWGYWLDKREYYENLATETGLDISIIDKVYTAYLNLRNQLTLQKPCLNHGDYFPKHIIVQDSKINGIIDWGEVRGDSPIYDFANWDYWVGERLPLKWLQDGYENKEIFGGNFTDELNFIKICIGLENLDWYNKQKYSRRITRCKDRIIRDIGNFQ